MFTSNSAATSVKRRKIAVLGRRSVGKSSLVKRFIENHFLDAYYPTIETTFAKSVKYKGLEYDCRIIDTAGLDEYSPINAQHAIGIHGYILVYSVTSRSSFDMIQIVYDKIIDFCGMGDIPCVIVGSESDLASTGRQVATADGAMLAKTNRAAFVEVSAKENINVDKVFELCLAEIEKRRTSSTDRFTSSLFNISGGSANTSTETLTDPDESHLTDPPTSSHTTGVAYTRSRTLICSLARSPVTRAQLAGLTGDDAQSVVDFLNQVLDDQDGQMELNERKGLLALLSKLARSAQVFPTCYRLQGVQCDLAKHHNFGGFGFIYKGMHRNHDICVKAVRLYSGGDNERNMKAHVKELVLWAHLSHENILPFYGVYLSDEATPRICIVSPWIRNGDLLAYLNAFPQGPRVLLISDIIAGLQYLHESKIIHSDLKASNVLVSDTQRAMLTDFGISHVSMTLLTTTQSPAGTANWMAPEMFKEDGAPATEESDIWAFGCVCYEIFTGEMPFSNYKNAAQLIFALIKGGIVPLRPAPRDSRKSEAEDQMWTLMEECWSYDPEKRPGCREIRQFIADLEVQDNRPQVDDRAAFLDMKRARFDTKISHERVYEILQQIQQ